jgi:hypothetical protein
MQRGGGIFEEVMSDGGGGGIECVGDMHMFYNYENLFFWR